MQMKEDLSESTHAIEIGSSANLYVEAQESSNFFSEIAKLVLNEDIEELEKIFDGDQVIIEKELEHAQKFLVDSWNEIDRLIRSKVAYNLQSLYEQTEFFQQQITIDKKHSTIDSIIESIYELTEDTIDNFKKYLSSDNLIENNISFVALYDLYQDSKSIKACELNKHNYYYIKTNTGEIIYNNIEKVINKFIDNIYLLAMSYENRLLEFKEDNNSQISKSEDPLRKYLSRLNARVLPNEHFTTTYQKIKDQVFPREARLRKHAYDLKNYGVNDIFFEIQRKVNEEIGHILDIQKFTWPIDLHDDEGFTLLGKSIVCSKINSAYLLLQKGASIYDLQYHINTEDRLDIYNITNPHGETLLEQAILNRHLELSNVLINIVNQIDEANLNVLLNPTHREKSLLKLRDNKHGSNFLTQICLRIQSLTHEYSKCQDQIIKDELESYIGTATILCKHSSSLVDKNNFGENAWDIINNLYSNFNHFLDNINVFSELKYLFDTRLTLSIREKVEIGFKCSTTSVESDIEKIFGRSFGKYLPGELYGSDLPLSRLQDKIYKLIKQEAINPNDTVPKIKPLPILRRLINKIIAFVKNESGCVNGQEEIFRNLLKQLHVSLLKTHANESNESCVTSITRLIEYIEDHKRSGLLNGRYYSERIISIQSILERFLFMVRDDKSFSHRNDDSLALKELRKDVSDQKREKSILESRSKTLMELNRKQDDRITILEAKLESLSKPEESQKSDRKEDDKVALLEANVSYLSSSLAETQELLFRMLQKHDIPPDEELLRDNQPNNSPNHRKR